MSEEAENRASGFIAVFVVVAILAIIAFRAAFSAYFLLDDFGMLAISRFLGNPLVPFIHDQFPGGLYYRPLGMLVWWFSERAFGAIPLGHYCLNLLLHGLVAFALGRLVKDLCANRWTGLAAAACFLLHPIGIGTTLWLSDRFDLLAMLFGLLGVHAALRYSHGRDRYSLWTTFAFLAMSLLSKEMALACFAGAATLWLSAPTTVSPARRIRDCSYLVLIVIVYLVIRSLILDRVNAEGLYTGKHLATLFRDGMVNWLSGWFDYFLFWARIEGWQRIVAIGSTLLVAAFGIASLKQPWSASRRQTLLVGLAIWLSSGLLQWPLLGHFSVRLAAVDIPIYTMVNARHFYVSLAGFLIVLAALLAPLSTSQRWRGWLALAALGLLVPWFAASQNLAGVQRTQTQQVETMVRAANAAISQLDLPAKGCQIYLLDTNEWSLGWVSDEAIKATAPDLERIAGCFIQTEHTPWYHIAVLDPIDGDGLLPMTLIEGATRQAAIRPLGKAKFVSLNLDARSKLPEGSTAQFLSWNGTDFLNVTDDVISGRRTPTFVCNRPASECPR